jgi:fluoroacetyl-CoA thioesterase
MFEIKDYLNIGQNYMITKVVEREDTAGEDCPEMSNFLCSAAIVRLAIHASVETIDKYLPDEFVSIGYNLSFTHETATLLGMTVTVKTTLIELNGNEVDLRVDAWDEQGDIGHGILKRRVVHKETLEEKAEQRARFLSNQRME